MAHSKSALKRWRQSLKRRDRNRAGKGRTRTILNRALTAVASDASSAEEAVKSALSALDKAAQKGIIHKNAASRSKSRLLKRYNFAVAEAVVSAASAPADTEAKPAPRARRASSTAKPPAAKKPAARTPRIRKS